MAIKGPRPRDPAPADIARMCAEIRSVWDERTHLVRSGACRTYEDADRGPIWTVPEVVVPDVFDWEPY